MGKDYFYLKSGDSRTPLGDKGEKEWKSQGDYRIRFRSGVRTVSRESLDTSCPNLPGGFETDEIVFALDTSNDQWERGERGKVLGSRTPGTLWVRFSNGIKDTHDVPPASISKKRPRSPSLDVSDSDLQEPEQLEKDLRKRTGLLVRHFSPRFHFSYTSQSVKNMKRMRGGEGFAPPLGYTKLALKVDHFPR